MTDRLVSVELRAKVAQYNREILSSAAATGVLAREADSADRSIDRFSGRLGLLLDTAASLGPSLIPIGAVGIPAVTGLASSLGFVATGLGAVLASTYGVSDSLKALNKYALEPTDANLAKVEQTLLKLAPEAQAFVLQLRRLGPELKEIRDAGAGELFPHWSDAIDDLETLLPTVEELVSRVAGKVGEISEQGAESLTSNRWTEFYSFLEKEAPLAISKIAHSVGSLGHATAELWMAFDPLNDDFLNVLVRGSDQIDKWATGLDKTEDFQEFVDYIETNGPQVGDTLGAIAMALLNIVEAGAPIGAAVLPVLETLADIVGTIADSDLGTPLLAVLALSRGMALLGRGIDSGPGKSVRTLTTDLKTMASTSVVAWGRSTEETERYNKAAERIRTTLGKLGKSGGMIAGLTLAQSGLADSIGLSNTAMGVALGLMGGPYGAAVGGLVGLGLDLTKSQESSAASVEELTATLDKQTGAITENTRATVAKALEDAGALKAAQELGIGLSTITDAALGNRDALHLLSVGYAENYSALTGLDDKARESAQGQESAWNRLMQAITGQTGNVADAVSEGERLAEATEHHGKAAERAVDPTKEVAKAIADLGDHALSTSEKADALKASLDALLGPQLDLSAATDSWRAGLRDLDDNLAENGRRLKGFTKDATDNRAEIRNRVTDLTEMLTAAAAAGEGEKRLAARLATGREALLDAGDAAGLSRKALGEYLTQLGLTPKLVKTILQLDGVEKSKGQAKDVKSKLEEIPPLKSVTIEAKNQQALAAIRAVQAARDALLDKTITIRTQHMDVRLGQPRATGGPVKAGSTYIVGERRPEVFVPETDGTILPSVSTRTALGGTSGGSGGSGGGPGSDSVGVLGKIIQAMLGAGFGPGLLRHFQKMLDEIQRGLAKNHGKWTDELRKQAHDLFKEVREAEKERGRAIREAFRSFEDDLADGAEAIRTELRDLKRDLRDAGGVWNDSLRKHAKRILDLAQRYDRQAAALDSQKAVLDDLVSTGEQLASAQQSFADQVAGNFSSDLFGKGLGGFFGTASKDTAQATMFTQVLQQLAGMGLDGPAFQALAASGDLKTATQLLSSGLIDAFEQAIGNRTSALGTLGGFAGDVVFGQQIADNAAAQNAQNALISSTQATMADLQAAVNRQEAVLRDLAGLPRHLRESTHDGAYWGTREGITETASNASRRVAMNRGPRS